MIKRIVIEVDGDTESSIGADNCAQALRTFAHDICEPGMLSGAQEIGSLYLAWEVELRAHPEEKEPAPVVIDNAVMPPQSIREMFASKGIGLDDDDHYDAETRRPIMFANCKETP